MLEFHGVWVNSSIAKCKHSEPFYSLGIFINFDKNNLNKDIELAL